MDVWRVRTSASYAEYSHPPEARDGPTGLKKTLEAVW